MDDSTFDNEPSVEPDDASPESPAVGLHDRRLARLADYQHEALNADDPLEANLAAVNGDLMSMAYMLQQVLGESLQQPPETIREMAEVMPAVDNFLKVSKQISNMSQLVVKLKGMNGAS